MGLNDTPSAERLHIGFFGMRNAGKSSIVNAVTGQELSVVSDVKGTTTDPVYKAMELLPMGPVVIIDTAGYDDTGALGALRVQKTMQALNRCDCAVLIIDGTIGKQSQDSAMETQFRQKGIPFLIVYNKADCFDTVYPDGITVSAYDSVDMYTLKETIAALIKTDTATKKIIGDKLNPGDTAVLVVPVDSAAPKGRLILPQQQTIRDILEADAQAFVVKENGLSSALTELTKKPAVVITDSQVFGKVSAVTPDDVLLTSFSILMARYKGFLVPAVRGAAALKKIKTGDRILISEGCTHHRQCEDIGTVKLPGWIRRFTGAEPKFEFSSGRDFPAALDTYKLIIHCGGCMLNEREMRYRMQTAQDYGVPFTNYGTVIAYMHGVLKRSLQIFPEIASTIE
ncbi:MAG: [Clostridia bacterium]|nr:[FeFe] hydrogenase H-cluster maturation GTPase HydF [Clostridia bacterium]